MDVNVVNQKIQELMEDKEFMEFLFAQDTYEKIQDAFASKNIELSLEEVKVIVSTVLSQMDKENDELDENELENVSGGVVLTTATLIALAKIGTVAVMSIAGGVIGWKLAGKK